MGQSRRIRLAAPVAVAGLIGLGSVVPSLTSASATPKLADVSAQQLVVRVQQASVPGFTGTVSWTANLGLPDLSALTSAAGAGGGDGSFKPTSLLSGTHTFQVWDGGAGRQRIAIPSTLAETDFVRNGDQAWQWDSGTQQITRFVSAPSSHGTATGASRAAADHGQSGPAPTPDQVATRLLGHLTPSTSVTVSRPVEVAGRAAYRLQLAPKPGTAGAAVSTVGQISIAVDAATGVPLEVAVYPTGSHPRAALKLGFTSFDPKVPAASLFAPPTGGRVTTKVVGGGSHPAAGADHAAATPAAHSGAQPVLSGAPWAETVTIPASSQGLRLGASTTKELDAATTSVTGSFGTARLLQTTLVNALIFPDGRVIAGFVTPAALEAVASAPTAS